MITSYSRFIKRTTRNTRVATGAFVLLGGLALTGCPDNTKPEPKVEAKILVDEKALSTSLINENDPDERKVDLPYTSQGGAVPTSCVVGALSKVVVSSSCVCVEGACSVGIRAKPRHSGNGYFEFRLSGQNGVWSSSRKVNVEILEVTLSIDSGDKQTETVGKPLPEPIVILAKNSDGVPVPGVKIFWSVKEKEGDREKDDKDEVVAPRSGQLSYCTEKTNDKGRAQCTFTLGTRLPVGMEGKANKVVDASAFYKYEENIGDDVGKIATFSATVNSGPATKLSFINQEYFMPEKTLLPDTLYYGPLWPEKLKTEKVNQPLGRVKQGIWVFAQDQYGNRAEVGTEVVNVTLTLMKQPMEKNESGGWEVSETQPAVKVEEGVLLGTTTAKLSNIPLEMKNAKWKQGVAKFKDLKVTKETKENERYSFQASASVSSFNTSSIFLRLPFPVEK